MTATFAVVVNGLTEDARRAVVRVKLGQLAHHDNVNQNSNQPLGVCRAARDVDNGGLDAVLVQELLNAHCTRRVGLSTHPATVHCARTQRHNSVSMLGSFNQMLRTRLTGNTQSVSAPTFQDGTLVDENVVASLDGALLGLFHGEASSGGKRLRVVQRQKLQDNSRCIGRVHLSEGLGAARAGCAFDPDGGIKLSLGCADDLVFKRVCHLRYTRRTQASSNGNSSA